MFFPAKKLRKLAEKAARKDPLVREELGRTVKIYRFIEGARTILDGEPDPALCTATLRGTDATLNAEGIYADGKYRLERLEVRFKDPERSVAVSLSE